MSRTFLCHLEYFFRRRKMTITERMFKTMEEKKITQGKLAKGIGIQQPTIGHWKSRGTTPPMEYLPQICAVLDVSWEYLVTGEDRTPHYTADERQLIAEYRKCNDVGKERIREYAQVMQTAHPDREPETEPKIC